MPENNLDDFISKNLASVKSNIFEACRKSCRAESSVRILAASKSQSVEKITVASKLGISVFGENYAKEFLEKYSILNNKINGRKIEWHFIGHLQRNKVKHILPYIDAIESLDSFKLAEKINDESLKLNKVANVFIEVNISEEDSKYGIEIGQLSDFCRQISQFEHISVSGLMCLPAFQISEMNRKHFKMMKEQFNRLRAMNLENFDIKELSIGTTNDYKIAVEEGSTIVRLGTALFGGRNA